MGAIDRPLVNAILFKEDGTPWSVGPNGIAGIATPGHAVSFGTIAGAVGLTKGYASTSSTAITPVRATAYTEPSSAQQMRLISSNNQDRAAGTGSKSVRITYFDGSMNGPFVEDVIMGGTTPALTVATNIQFIESLETLTVGSNGTNVGTISVQDSSGSNTFGTIAISEGLTWWSHHYVGTGRRCFVTRIIAGVQGNNANLFLRAMDVLTANAFDRQITMQIRSVNAQPSQMYDLDSNFSVLGPSRITLYCKSDSGTANTVYGGFSFYEL